jgi:hypothetical protein
MKGWQPEVKNQQQFETITLYLVKEIVFFFFSFNENEGMRFREYNIHWI